GGPRGPKRRLAALGRGRPGRLRRGHLRDRERAAAARAGSAAAALLRARVCPPARAGADAPGQVRAATASDRVVTREWRLRTRWTGTCVPEWGPPRPEPWAVYVLEGRWQWTVVGRLLERPWCRVGGGGEMADSDGP